MEYRLYNKVSASGKSYNRINCSLFDLIGNKEPDQTKGFGYVLAKSHFAMKSFLGLLGVKSTHLLKQKWIVDCELIQGITNNQTLRADIIVRFYDNYKPTQAIIIEAKTATSSINNVHASQQVANYRSRFFPLKAYNPANILMVTLTTVVDYCSNNSQVKSLTWQMIRESFSAPSIRKSNSYEAKLISDYINYINHLQNTMFFYDEEILSIPAGNTIKSVNKHALYECPITGKYKSRGEKHPLYVAFRHSKQNGRIEKLYKIQDIIMLDLDDTDAIDAIDSTGMYPCIKNRIEGYKLDEPNYKKGTKWVFVLDNDKSIILPYPVEYAGSIQGLAGTTYLSLAEVFQKPQPNQNIVYIQLKKNKSCAQINNNTP